MCFNFCNWKNKNAKNILDKKVFTSIVCTLLQYLQNKKWEHLYITNLKKVKTNVYNKLANNYFCITIFAINKVKTAEKIFNKKNLTTSIFVASTISSTL